ncbi:hypothetical protein C5C59_05265 [Rathayibacter sp. AY1F4]|nr:hypothetical protein C5C26_11690 [Rathayibacter sp. AY2B1]PPG72890.1 hypothetical protein C5C59_05265 [Rathayibacter sp. AY1F4]
MDLGSSWRCFHGASCRDAPPVTGDGQRVGRTRSRSARTGAGSCSSGRFSWSSTPSTDPAGSGSRAANRGHAADLHGWTRFVSMQDQYSLLYREEEREMFGLLADQGVGSIPYSPLAKGRVARPAGEQTQRSSDDPVGNAFFADTERDRPVIDAVQKIAEARGVSMAQIAMAWVLNNPVVSAPIIGATKPHHLDDAAAAVDIDLTPDEVTALEEHYQVRPAGGF